MELSPEQRAALDALPPKRRAFVLFYVGESAGNQTDAARRAGYASPKAEGCRLLTYADVCDAVEKLKSPAEKSAHTTREERLALYASFARDPKVPVRDRLKAAELAGKVGGDFLDRLAISGDEGRPAVQVTLTMDEAKRIARGGRR